MHSLNLALYVRSRSLKKVNSQYDGRGLAHLGEERRLLWQNTCLFNWAETYSCLFTLL